MLSLALAILLQAAPVARSEGYDDAARAAVEALAKGENEAAQSALESLVSLADPRALGLFDGQLIEILPRLRTADSRLEVLEGEHERRTRQLERRRLNAKDDSDKAGIAEAEKKLKDWIEKDLEPARKEAARHRSRRDLLSKATVDLLAKLPLDRRASESARLGKLVQDATRPWPERVAAMECYARMGDKDSVTNLLRVGREATKERKRLLEELPKREAEYEKVKEIYHRERIQNGGNQTTKATAQQFEKAQREVLEFTDRLFAQAQLVEAGFRLSAAAVSALPDDARSRAVGEILQLARASDLTTRLAAIEVLGGVSDPAVLTFLRGSISASGTDAGTKVACIDALAALKDEGALESILDKCLKDPEWTIRASAIQALRSIRAAKAIPALIAALENETGRLRDDANESLRSLTGLEYVNAKSWKSWWEKSQGGFTPVASASRPAKKKEGEGTVAFAGIRTSSRNIAFVVDVSGSMNFSMDQEKEASTPEKSRFALLKRELVSAIERVPDGGAFALLTFSSFVTNWTPKLETMRADLRKRAIDFVQKEMKAEGSTNIYGALKEAFQVAGIGAGDKYYHPSIDTIFFLTDGTPSNDSEVTDKEKILAAVRQWNRLGKISIHVVCLGEADALFLKKLAEQNNGEFAQP